MQREKGFPHMAKQSYGIWKEEAVSMEAFLEVQKNKRSKRRERHWSK